MHDPLLLLLRVLPSILPAFSVVRHTGVLPVVGFACENLGPGDLVLRKGRPRRGCDNIVVLINKLKVIAG